MAHDKHIYFVDELKVVGFADFIGKTTVPRRVAPIFQFNKEAHDCIFPPFRLIDELVVGGNLGSEADFIEMVEERNATRLPVPIDAQKSGMLWVDENLEVHYGIQEQENKILNDLAGKRLLLGYQAFELGDYETALSCARWASAANQRSLNALVLEAAVYHIGVNKSGLKLMKQMAADVPDGYFFDEEVSRLVRLYIEKREDVPVSGGKTLEDLAKDFKAFYHYFSEEQGRAQTETNRIYTDLKETFGQQFDYLGKQLIEHHFEMRSQHEKQTSEILDASGKPYSGKETPTKIAVTDYLKSAQEKSTKKAVTDYLKLADVG
jgi:hypothetical protein